MKAQKMKRKITIIKSKGQPDAVLVQRVPDKGKAGKPMPIEPMQPVKIKPVKITRRAVRITPKQPRIS